MHGLSEHYLCSSIKSNLKIKHKIISRERGKTSIQVTSVLDTLNDSRFCDYKSFIREFDYVETVRKGRLLNFRLFIIMDIDDCSEKQKKSFKNKKMFADHWLYEYITPIYSDPNLEAAMKSTGIEVDSKKNYIKIFPTSHGDLNMEMAREYLKKLERSQCSNISEYIRYCLQIVQERR